MVAKIVAASGGMFLNMARADLFLRDVFKTAPRAVGSG
jgi:hypothetical protein